MEVDNMLEKKKEVYQLSEPETATYIYWHRLLTSILYITEVNAGNTRAKAQVNSNLNVHILRSEQPPETLIA